MPVGEIITAFATPGFVGVATALTLFGGCAGAVLDRAWLSVWPVVKGEFSRRRVMRSARRRGVVLRPADHEVKVWCAENGVPYPPPRVHESTPRALCGPAKTVTAPAGVLAPPSAGMDAHHGPVKAESPDVPSRDTWTAPAPSAVDVLISKGQAESTLAPRERLMLSTARVLVAPHVQVADYLDYVRAHDLGKCPVSGRLLCTRSCDAWFAAYVKWANARGIELAPRNTFLKFLKAAPGVESPRPRIKGVNGNVIKLDTPGRSPARKVHYTVLALSSRASVAHPQPRGASGERRRRAA